MKFAAITALVAAVVLQSSANLVSGEGVVAQEDNDDKNSNLRGGVEQADRALIQNNYYAYGRYAEQPAQEQQQSYGRYEQNVQQQARYGEEPSPPQYEAAVTQEQSRGGYGEVPQARYYEQQQQQQQPAAAYGQYEEQPGRMDEVPAAAEYGRYGEQYPSYATHGRYGEEPVRREEYPAYTSRRYEQSHGGQAQAISEARFGEEPAGYQTYYSSRRYEQAPQETQTATNGRYGQQYEQAPQKTQTATNGRYGQQQQPARYQQNPAYQGRYDEQPGRTAEIPAMFQPQYEEQQPNANARYADEMPSSVPSIIPFEDIESVDDEEEPSRKPSGDDYSEPPPETEGYTYEDCIKYFYPQLCQYWYSIP